MVQCFRCGKCMKSQQRLDYHLSKRFSCINKCKYCDTQFTNKTAYKNHMKSCSVAFNVDNLVYIISNVHGKPNAITYLLNDDNVVVSNDNEKFVEVGESYFKGMQRCDADAIKRTIESAIEHDTCVVSRKHDHITYFHEVVLHVVYFSGNEYVVAIETTTDVTTYTQNTPPHTSLISEFRITCKL